VTLRVLVTGAGGQLGTDVARTFAAAGDEVIAATAADLDVRRRDQVVAVITAARPDVVVHCAACTDVDRCESEVERAYLVNALAVRFVAEACRQVAAHLVHISTDYVFSGDDAAPYREWDTPGPRSVYGATKLAGEREAGPDATVIRTSWLCGATGRNMVKTVMRLAADGGQLAFVDDQRGHPTFTDDLAGLVRLLALERRRGIHHVTNQGPVSWFEFAQAVVTAMGRDPAIVRPISTAELRPARAAKRPSNSVLDNAVLRLSGYPLLPDFHEPLRRLVGQLGRANGA
jgi:dTDP-4-dehydrorhamnose reductase